MAEAQVVATQWIERTKAGRRRHRRGELVTVSDAEFEKGLATGLLRAPSSEPLPGPNHAAVPGYATEPDGTPIPDLPLGVVAGDGSDDADAPSTHAEADELADELGISFEKNTKLGEKVAAIAQVRAAQAAAGGAAVPAEDLSELDDDELRARGLEAGLSEGDVADLERDALLLAVAEAVGRRRELEQG